jgi:hypothetical protein
MNIIEHYKAGSTDAQVVEDAIAMLEKQGCRGHDGTSCRYFVPDSGAMCAAGLMLPDAEKYKSVGGGINMLIERAKQLSDSELVAAITLYGAALAHAQNFHDGGSYLNIDRLSRIYSLDHARLSALHAKLHGYEV